MLFALITAELFYLISRIFCGFGRKRWGGLRLRCENDCVRLAFSQYFPEKLYFYQLFSIERVDFVFSAEILITRLKFYFPRVSQYVSSLLYCAQKPVAGA